MTKELAMPFTTDIDYDFVRRSVTYLLKNNYRADQIVAVLTNDLAVAPEMAHQLVSETTELVAA